MKPSWYQMTEDAELEALQTDVMRFMAILGLCLAAIFSLVQSAEQEPQAPAPASTRDTAPEFTLESRSESNFEPGSIPEPGTGLQPVTEPDAEKSVATSSEKDVEPNPVQSLVSTPAIGEQQGFSLEFASASALLKLHNSGQLRLFAQVQGQFWTLDLAGAFHGADAPASYYRMQSATVPVHLPILLAQATGQAIAEWGVQLAPALVEQLQRIMRERAGGELVIQADGRVAVGQENTGVSG